MTIHPPTPVDALMDELTRPMYNWRMARGMLANPWIGASMRKSAETRLRNARIEIDNIVKTYATNVLRMKDEFDD